MPIARGVPIALAIHAIFGPSCAMSKGGKGAQGKFKNSPICTLTIAATEFHIGDVVGSLPAVPASGARTAGVRKEIWFEAMASDPSFATLVQLVSDTESMFGVSSEERDWWDIPVLTAAVGSLTCLADSDGLRALIK